MVSGVELSSQELDAAAFAPYGTVVDVPIHPVDAYGAGWRWWASQAQLPLIDRPYVVGYLQLEPTVQCFDWAEQHRRTVEMIIPVGGDCLMYVAVPDALRETGQPLDLTCFSVFRLRCGQSVILQNGVWHGAPLAIDNPLTVLIVLAEGTGQRDTAVVRFGATPVAIVQ